MCGLAIYRSANSFIIGGANANNDLGARTVRLEGTVREIQNYNNFCSNCVSSQQRIADKKANLPLIFKLMKNKKPKKKGEIEEVVGEILEAGKEKKEIKKKKVGIIPRHTIFGCNAIGTNSPQEAPLTLKKFSAELQILMKRHKIIKVEAFLLAKWPEDPFIIGQKIKK